MIPWDKFYPTMLEVKLAQEYFMKSIAEHYEDVRDGSMSIETAFSCALAEVWTEAKKYQDKKNKALTQQSISDLRKQLAECVDCTIIY